MSDSNVAAVASVSSVSSSAPDPSSIEEAKSQIAILQRSVDILTRMMRETQALLGSVQSTVSSIAVKQVRTDDKLGDLTAELSMLNLGGPTAPVARSGRGQIQEDSVADLRKELDAITRETTTVWSGSSRAVALQDRYLAISRRLDEVKAPRSNEARKQDASETYIEVEDKVLLEERMKNIRNYSSYTPAKVAMTVANPPAEDPIVIAPRSAPRVTPLEDPKKSGSVAQKLAVSNAQRAMYRGSTPSFPRVRPGRR